MLFRERSTRYNFPGIRVLKQELSDVLIEGDKERYQLTWPGKKEAILTANTPIDKTLRPVREDSVDWDTTQNLYIEGDNSKVLKLLQESYLNKVKCIYIVIHSLKKIGILSSYRNNVCNILGDVG